jgi:hypothetical protein
VIVGRRYLLRDQEVIVLIQWATPRPNLDSPVLPMVRTARAAPRNVLIRFPDGSMSVRPFRGLHRINRKA